MDGYGFDLSSLMGLMGGFQERMAAMRDKAANTEVEGVAAGGMVKVRLTCDQEVRAVSIAPEAMADREILEDLVRAATDDALRRVKGEMARMLSEATGGLPIPPGLIPGLP